MSKCKSCGEEIIWIQMASGKKMPCNAVLIPFKANLHHGKMTLITKEGKVTKGDLDYLSDRIAYESHFNTCPAASRYRKRR